MLLSGGREEGLKMMEIVYLRHRYWRVDLGADPRIGVILLSQRVTWKIVSVRIGVQLMREFYHTHQEMWIFQLDDLHFYCVVGVEGE
jgi:hypothetical protein